MSAPAAYLLLEDGTRFDGFAVGAEPGATGEVVFNTSMGGYQEAVTDPSYRGQILTFTYPMIGNYGVADAFMESERPQVRGVVMRQAAPSGSPEHQGSWENWLAEWGVPAITGVNTRSLVRHIRDKGAMRGGIFLADRSVDEAMEAVAAEPSMVGADFTEEVAVGEATLFGDGQAAHVVGIDTGVKRSIIDGFVQRGMRLELFPPTTPAAQLIERDPDFFFLANGPGDPAALDSVVETVRALVGVKPIFGICMGHQLLCRAIGLETFKLPFGHRGSNHPVKNLATGKIDITCQNHGFAVQTPDGSGVVEADEPVRWETDFGLAELSHVNLYDRTVEGLVLKEAAGATVQYHPEAGPGPHDARYLFDNLLDLV